MTTDTADVLAESMLRAWAGCVRRLMAVAPTEAVMDETGIVSNHSTPVDRKAIRAEALATVDRWLERDLAALTAKPSPSEGTE